MPWALRMHEEGSLTGGGWSRTKLFYSVLKSRAPDFEHSVQRYVDKRWDQQKHLFLPHPQMWTWLTLPNDAASSQDAPAGMDIELHAGWVTFLLSTPHWFLASQNFRIDSPILRSITAWTYCPWRKHTCVCSLWHSQWAPSWVLRLWMMKAAW